MKTYKFIIKETLSREVIIEAEDRESAEIIVEERYKNEDIVLTADDFDRFTIEVKDN